jgi:alpha-ketoglutarate-dependent taurine dioxygenase
VLRIEAGPGDPAARAAEHREELAKLLPEHGAVLISGLSLSSAADLAGVRQALGYRPARPREHFAERHELADGVWSPPSWPADREQCLHHEGCYGVDFPRVLLMTCLVPPQAGGELLLGDTRQVLARVPPPLRERFRAEGWRFERNFRPHFGLQWPAAFGVATPADAERFCAERLIGCAWRPDGVLHVAQRRPAVVRHPETGHECWFNDVAFFSQWSVDAEERRVLLAAFGPAGLPFSTAFGGGDPLSEPDWRALLDAYEAVMCRVPWRPGDLVVIDNVLTAHGRTPYSGRLLVAVAPAETVSLAECRPAVPPAPG